MKLQTSTTLALFSVLEAAMNRQDQLSAADIANKYGVSTHHLAKVLRELGRAGILTSSRGVGGGYRLSGNARRLTLLDIIERFEDISAHSLQAQETSADAGRALRRVFSEIDDIAKATFRSITIDTMVKLVQRERHKESESADSANAAPGARAAHPAA